MVVSCGWLGLKHCASVRKACISQMVIDVNTPDARNVKIVEIAPGEGFFVI
jgi:hypothetical protein